MMDCFRCQVEMDIFFLYKGAYLVLVGESMLSLIFMWELKGTL